jgi:hypothetical protein
MLNQFDLTLLPLHPLSEPILNSLILNAVFFSDFGRYWRVQRIPRSRHLRNYRKSQMLVFGICVYVRAAMCKLYVAPAATCVEPTTDMVCHDAIAGLCLKQRQICGDLNSWIYNSLQTWQNKKCIYIKSVYETEQRQYVIYTNRQPMSIILTLCSRCQCTRGRCAARKRSAQRRRAAPSRRQAQGASRRKARRVPCPGRGIAAARPLRCT